MKKDIKNASFLLLICLSFLVASCSQPHPCTGVWEGGRNGSVEDIMVTISKDGKFKLFSWPKGRDLLGSAACECSEYSGIWTPLSESEIELSSNIGIYRKNYEATDVKTSAKFYLRQDGALCVGSPDFSDAVYSLTKQK